VSTVAVLPPQPAVIGPEAADALGLPECVVGQSYWFESVPTDVDVGPGGRLFVSLLPGGPEDDSLGARGSVVVVSPKAGTIRTVATGLVGATGLAVGPKGTVYVAEMFGGRITAVQGFTKTTVAEVPLPGDIDATADGLLATVNVLPMDETSPPDGQVVLDDYPRHGRP
jgi:hypothetical protein